MNTGPKNPPHEGAMRRWLPDMDLNHDKQIQSLLCYRYTIRQCKGVPSLMSGLVKSSAYAV